MHAWIWLTIFQDRTLAIHAYAYGFYIKMLKKCTSSILFIGVHKCVSSPLSLFYFLLRFFTKKMSTYKFFNECVIWASTTNAESLNTITNFNSIFQCIFICTIVSHTFETHYSLLNTSSILSVKRHSICCSCLRYYRVPLAILIILHKFRIGNSAPYYILSYVFVKNRFGYSM